MISLVYGGSEQNADLVAMYRGRRSVFVDRLRWPLKVTSDGQELDEFDGDNALYLIARDASGTVQGSLRLMPTTGPTLLTQVFSEIFDEPVDIRSATIWDATRFCVHAEAVETTRTGVHRVTAELCQGLAEVALRSGLDAIIAIYDARMMRVYARIGWSPECLATSRPGSGYHPSVHVGLWQVSREALAGMRARSGIVGSVLLDDSAVQARSRAV